MENLETSRSLVKSTLMYKIVLMINLSPSNSPLQNSTIVASTIILGILKLIYHFQGQKGISSNVVLSIVVQCTGTIFLTRQNNTIAFRMYRQTCLFAFCWIAQIP